MKKTLKRIAGALTAAAMAVTMLLAELPAGVKASAADVSGYTVMEITRDMGVGWNLGNSLDATGGSGLGTETSWGNPKTTKSMINAVKAKGFKTIRIPVTWYKHMDSSNKVDAQWMARVKEVVNYAYNNGMYVILDSHHDEWNRPTDSNYSAASAKLKALWKQIANEFKGYDRRLIFEGMNEPRNYNGSDEWNGGTTAMRNVVNKLNADFVNTVRATGGNNATRPLMIPTYGASDTLAAMSDLKIPNDDNIIVSVHAYEPYNFTMNTGGGAVSTWSSDLDSNLQKIIDNIYNTFVANGTPVVIGEMSASNKGNLSARVSWAKAYASKAKKYGIPIVLWDNGAYASSTSSGEQHGYLNRSSSTWYSQSESVVSNLISTYKNTSMSLPAAQSAGTVTEKQVLDSSTFTVSGYSPNESHKVTTFSVKNADKNAYICVTYTGAVPELAISYSPWITMSPTMIKDGVAYYKISEIISKGGMDKWMAVCGAGGNTTVKRVAYCTVSTTTSIATAKINFTYTAYKYIGSAITPSFTVTLNGKTLKSGTDYTYKLSNNVEPGTATLTVTGKGSYTGTVKGAFTIVGKTDISTGSIKLSSTSFQYTGSKIEPTVTVTVGGKTLTKNTDYTVAYTNNVNSGTATVTVTGKGDYTGTLKTTFTIKPVSGAAITLKNAKQALSVSDATVSFKSSSGSTVTSKVTAGKLTVTGLSTGSYTVTVTKPGYVTRTYSQTVASTNQSFTFEIHMKGDINGDGSIDASDLGLLIAHVKGTRRITDTYDLAVSDINGDKKTDDYTADLGLMIAHVKGTKKIA